jgi:hypothetical protein
LGGASPWCNSFAALFCKALKANSRGYKNSLYDELKIKELRNATFADHKSK